MKRTHRAPLVLLAAALSPLACETMDPTATTNAPLTCRGCSDLYIVAHQDDDLLFMNPDIMNSIQAGNTVRTTFVTAGDASDSQAYWLAREAGIRQAYAQMAGVANSWTVGPEIIGGRSLQVRRLIGTNVSVIFLRLPDPTNGDPSLAELWSGATATLSSRDGLNTYTRGQLIDVLHQIMIASAAQRVATLDSTGNHLSDHRDHIHSALFAYSAHERYTSLHTLSIYRTYTIESYRVNLSSSEIATKWSVFRTYAANDSHIGGLGSCPANETYCNWTQRQYAFSSDNSGSSVIGVTDGRCLAVNAASPFSGVGLRLNTCTAPGALRFTIGTNQTISASGLCMTANGSSATFNTCSGAANQKFTMTNNGQIRAPGGLCLESSGGDSLAIVNCPSSQVLNWTMQPRDASFFSVTNQFGNAEGTSPWYAQTFRLGDLNADGRADACMRKTDGVYCALNNGSSFNSYTRWTTEFSDGAGWGSDMYGTTLQLGDINGDGRADVCARGSNGIWCAHANSTATGFLASSLRSSFFTDAMSWNVNAAYYRSIRLGDVNGDGIKDICGRGGAGMWCGLGQSSGNFLTPTLWITNEFTDALGWLTDITGPTMQLGDINGDGRADVCGRGNGGVICALSTGASFANGHPWTFQNDYSDGSGFGAETYAQSMRLADIDGDGGADVCVRGAAGIYCSTTNGGNSFSPTRLFLPRDLGDAQGWNPAYHGATIALGDLDGDGRADVCGRGGSRLICAVR